MTSPLVITAAVREAPGAPFVLQEVLLDAPRPDELRVHLTSTGVCGTDLEFASFLPDPVVLGHEGTGIVESVGADVTDVEVGDRVLLSFESCGDCAACGGSRSAYCDHFDDINFGGGRSDGSSAVSRDGAPLASNFLGQSSFATHVVVKRRTAVKVDADLDTTLLAPLGCGYQTGAGAVLNVLRPQAGSTIAVIGAGAVGAAALMAAATTEPGELVAVDIEPGKLEAAIGYGATQVVQSGRDVDLTAALLGLVPGGFDLVVETTGRADVLAAAVAALAKGGAAAVVGVGASEEIVLDWRTILNGRTITGVIAGSSEPQQFIPQLLDLHRDGRFPVDQLATTFPFSAINEAIDAVRGGRVGKAILTF